MEPVEGVELAPGGDVRALKLDDGRVIQLLKAVVSERGLEITARHEAPGK